MSPSRDIEPIGSAHDEAEPTAAKAAAYVGRWPVWPKPSAEHFRLTGMVPLA